MKSKDFFVVLNYILSKQLNIYILELFNEILKREPTYIGSYYHLGKLLERIGDTPKAIRVYERGMEEAKKANDHHSYSELQAAFEDAETE